MVIDVDALIGALPGDSPSGEDLEYDPQFTEMEREANPKEAQALGDAVAEEDEPNWNAVRDQALALFARTRDLRIGVHLARALLHTDGWSGFADGLAVLRGLVDEQWETLHPQLDPEDDNDPTMRMNVLATLCDAQATLGSLRRIPLVRSRGLGSFSIRDIDLAEGRIEPRGEEEPVREMAAIDAAFMDVDVSELQATSDAIHLSEQQVRDIETVVTERVGAGSAVNLETLTEELGRARAVVDDRLARRGVGATGAADAAGQPALDAAGAAAAGPEAVGGIRSTQDVIRVLDLVCDYYAKNEPSSPVPLLIRRAKRLVSKDFLAILRDLAPDGVAQVEIIGGTNQD